MPLPAPDTRMTADEFIAWSMEQPETEQYELSEGEIVAMAPERAAHARAKGHLYIRLIAAIDAAGAACETFIDSLAVVVDDTSVYEPDVLVRCGPRLPDDAVRISDPAIIVEVVSRSSRGRDTGIKLTAYFQMPSVHHYLIVRAEQRVIVHHARIADGTIATRILRDGPIVLDPPGIVLTDPFPPRA